MTIEQEALLLDRSSVILLVSARRILRDAAAKLLASRYRDGEVDAVALSKFSDAVDEAAEQMGETAE